MRSIWRALAAFALAAAVFSGCAVSDADPLAGTVVVASAPADVPGYDRSCGQGHGCVFGPAWSDDVNVRLGHNGCDTRNDMLGEALTERVYRPGTHSCVVVGGVLHDPYTGRTVEFTKAQAGQVQVDHVFPLSVAWDRGAADWSADRRRDFANDPDNLVVTLAQANLSKRDRTPAGWLPDSEPGRCVLVAKFVNVARTYQLPITAAEADVARATLSQCTK